LNNKAGQTIPDSPRAERGEEAAAEQFAEDHEIGTRGHKGATRWLIPVVAGGWSCFQLALPKLIILDSVTVRSIHLAFAAALVFLSFPLIKRRSFKGFFSFLTDKTRLPWVDLLLSVAAAASACYVLFDYTGIAERMGDPNTRDIIIGGILVILLLEAARRSLGLPLPILAALFMAYCYWAERMPDALRFTGRSIPYIISKLTMGDEGVFGIPLGVSASTVFLFVLFGSMLEKSGGGRFFVQLSFSLLGRFKGGPAKAAVLASGLTGMVSGSSIANTVTTGTFTIPLMKRCGYPAEKAAAVEVAASTNGQLMPPIMGAAAFIIAEYCGIPYLDVVRAAFIPAIISYLALIYITHIEASKLNLKGVPVNELPAFGKTLAGGLHFLIPLFFLIYELVIARHSAQLSVFWAIVVLMALIVVKNMAAAIRGRVLLHQAVATSAKQIWESLVAGGRNMMGIGVAVAAAGIIVGAVTMGPGQLISGAVESLSGGNIIMILIMTALASLLLGMGLPTTATYIVMASLTAKIIENLAGGAGLMMPLISAHLFCFYFGILADDTPPVGLAAYAASAIAKSNPIRTGIQGFAYDLRTALLPFMFVFNSELLLLQYRNGKFVNIQNGWHILLIFSTSLIAMLAFAALTMNYFFRKNRFHESLMLLLTTAILLRPRFFINRIGIPNIYAWYSIGIGLFVITYIIQRTNPKTHTHSVENLSESH